MNVANMVRGALNGPLIYSVCHHPFCLPAAVQNVHLCNMQHNEIRYLTSTLKSHLQVFNKKSWTRGIRSFTDIYFFLFWWELMDVCTKPPQSSIVWCVQLEQREGLEVNWLCSFKFSPKIRGYVQFSFFVLTQGSVLPFIHLVFALQLTPSVIACLESTSDMLSNHVFAPWRGGT